MIIRSPQCIGNGDRTDDDILDQRMVVHPTVDYANKRRVIVECFRLGKFGEGQVDMLRGDEIGLWR